MVSLGNFENILEREICNGYYAHLPGPLFATVYKNALQLNSNHLQGNKEIEQQEEKVGQ
mgnify:CR=1 FL=1